MASQSKSITPFQQMIASCSGALLTSVFVTPLDVVKIRLQAQQKEFMKNKCYIYCDELVEGLCCGIINHGNRAMGYVSQSSTQFLRSHHFTGTADAFIKIVRAEGLPSLWSGLPPTLIMSVPATVVYFTVYDQLKEKIRMQLQTVQTPLWVPMVAGASARVFAASFVSPIELVRTKMQSKKLSYFQVCEAVRNQIRYQGILSLWRGLGPTILRDVPFSCTIPLLLNLV